MDPQKGVLICTFGLPKIDFVGSQHGLLLGLNLDPQKSFLGAQDGPVLGPDIPGFSNPGHVGNFDFYDEKKLFWGPGSKISNNFRGSKMGAFSEPIWTLKKHTWEPKTGPS